MFLFRLPGPWTKIFERFLYRSINNKKNYKVFQKSLEHFKAIYKENCNKLCLLNVISWQLLNESFYKAVYNLAEN